MKVQVFLLSIFLLLVHTGCRKVGDNTVTGTVIEEGTGQPFPNVKVYVVRTNKSGESERAEPRTIASTITDAEGHYSLPFFRQFNHYHTIYCEPVPDDHDTYTDEKKKGLDHSKGSADFTLSPFAYLKLNLHKTTSVITNSSYLKFDQKKGIVLHVPNHTGDTVHGVYRVVANKAIDLSWDQNYGDPGVWNQGQDIVTVNKGDTLFYTINLY